MITHYRFAEAASARTAHAAIDDARLGGDDRHWPDGATERHTSLTRDGSDWLIATTDFTESLRGSDEKPGPMWGTLPEPVEVDFSDQRSIEKVNPKRTDVLKSRRKL